MRNRLRALEWTLSAALLTAIFLTPRLWLTERPYPALPLLRGLPDLPQWAAVTLTCLLALSIAGVAAARRSDLPAGVSFACGAILVVFDINRLQPWFYQYMLMFGAVALANRADPDSRRSKALVAACAFVVISIYVWSGVQKGNLTFAGQVFPALVQPLGDTWAHRLRPFWFAVPALEAMVGLLLLFRRTRSWGLVGAVVMHACILLTLGPLGQNVNPIVWPWNIAMAVMAIVLFHRNDEPILRHTWSLPYGKALVLLVGVMPALSVAGRWEGPLSASLYSGRQPDAWIYLTERGVAHMADKYRSSNPALTRETPDRFRLDVTRWAESAMNVPPYAEPRVYKDLLKKLEIAGVPRGEMLLLVRDDPGIRGVARTYSAVK